MARKAWSAGGRLQHRCQPALLVLVLLAERPGTALGVGRSGGCCQLMVSAPQYCLPRLPPGFETVPVSANPETPRLAPAGTGPSGQASFSWISPTSQGMRLLAPALAPAPAPALIHSRGGPSDSDWQQAASSACQMTCIIQAKYSFKTV